MKNQVIQGDCIEEMKKIPDGSVDSIVTDPPYELGFMGKSWDNTGIANDKNMWAECLRVLKPGGYLLSFGGTRTYHRMAVAIEDAGFEVRDMIEWVYGSGFPKSLNIGKAIDKMQGNEREIIGEYEYPDGKPRNHATHQTHRNGIYSDIKTDGSPNDRTTTKGTSEWEGWGTALKPAHEPICMARKPLAEKTVAENVLKYGTGGINIDESRVEGENTRLNGRSKQADDNNGIFTGYGDQEKGEKDYGRFPANLIHDNSEEVRECFPNTKSGGAINAPKTSKAIWGNAEQPEWEGFNDSGNASRFFKSVHFPCPYVNPDCPKCKNKSIIYQAKASKSERNKGCEGLEEKSKVFNGQSDKPSEDMKDVEKRFTTLPKANNHPTVKPVALMEYLINMVTPKMGVVLDPFAGSGTTGVACQNLNRNYILIEKEPEYIDIINKRLNQRPQPLF